MKTTVALVSFLLASVSVNAIALPGEEFHVIKDTDAGPVYSNVPAHQRRDAPETFYPISTNEDGTVYSNVAPTDHQKRDNTAYTPLSDDEAKEYIEEKQVINLYLSVPLIGDEGSGTDIMLH